MKQLVIKCDNIHQKIAAIALASSVGYTYMNCDAKTLMSSKNQDVYDMSFPHVLLKFDEWDVTYNNIIDFVTNGWDDYGVVMLNFVRDLKEINEAIFNRASNTVKISEDYNATVTSEGIQVGCQTIKFEDFDKLAALVKNIR